MRIISKFKDYYDGVQSYGSDHSIVYERKTKEVTIPMTSLFADVINESTRPGVIFKLWKNGKRYTDEFLAFHEIIIGFCGKLYLGYKFDIAEKGEIIKSKVFYQWDQAIQFIEENSKVYSTDHLQDTYRYYNLTPKNRLRRRDWDKDWKKNFGQHDTKLFERTYLDWFHQVGSPIWVYPDYTFMYQSIKGRNWYRTLDPYDENIELVKDPSLKVLEFYQVVDPYSCYQSIQQFLSGVLGNIEKDGRPLTDIQKVKQHGFDAKYGFRTRPKK